MTKAKTGTIGSSLRARMAEGGGKQPDEPETPEVPTKVETQGAITQSAVEAKGERPEAFNTRLIPTLQRRVKMFSVSQGFRIQDIVHDALQEYLDRKEGNSKR